MTTLCRDCDLVHSDTRKLPPYRWVCLALPIKLSAPLPDLDPDWHPSPPYDLCKGYRAVLPGSDCPHFEPRRTNGK